MLLQRGDHQFILPLKPNLNCRIQRQKAGAPHSVHSILSKRLTLPFPHTHKNIFHTPWLSGWAILVSYLGFQNLHSTQSPRDHRLAEELLTDYRATEHEQSQENEARSFLPLAWILTLLEQLPRWCRENKIISVFFTWASVPLNFNSNWRWSCLSDHCFIKEFFNIYSRSTCAEPNSWDMATQGQTPLQEDLHAEAHSWQAPPGRGIVLSVRQSPADPSIPLTIASPFISSPTFSWRLRETEISPGLLQRRARIAVWAVCLLSCSHCSGSHHNVDFCQRDGPASHLSRSALITFDQLRLESSFNQFWEK